MFVDFKKASSQCSNPDHRDSWAESLPDDQSSHDGTSPKQPGDSSSLEGYESSELMSMAHEEVRDPSCPNFWKGRERAIPSLNYASSSDEQESPDTMSWQRTQKFSTYQALSNIGYSMQQSKYWIICVLFDTNSPTLKDYLAVNPLQVLSSITEYISLGLNESKDGSLMSLEDIYQEYQSQLVCLIPSFGCCVLANFIDSRGSKYATNLLALYLMI